MRTRFTDLADSNSISILFANGLHLHAVHRHTSYLLMNCVLMDFLMSFMPVDVLLHITAGMVLCVARTKRGSQHIDPSAHKKRDKNGSR